LKIRQEAGILRGKYNCTIPPQAAVAYVSENVQVRLIVLVAGPGGPGAGRIQLSYKKAVPVSRSEANAASCDFFNA